MKNKVLEWKTVEERQMEVANRLKKARKALKISRKDLSVQSGIPVPTIRHFEDSGSISLYGLIAIATALDYKDDIDNLFKNTTYLDIEDMIDEHK